MEFTRRAKGLPHGVLASIADSLTFLKMCQDPVHGGSYMVPGSAYRLLGSDCPSIVSRDLLHRHMVFAYSSVVRCYVSPLATAFIDVWGCTSMLSIVVD